MKFSVITAKIFLLCIAGLLMTVPLSLKAAETASQKSDGQSQAGQSVQADVDRKVTDAFSEKRQKVLTDAVDALNATWDALTALEKNKPDQAIEDLSNATGKLELVIVRSPDLALAPVDVDISIIDLTADPAVARQAVEEVEELIEDGKVQQARPLLAQLASEIQIHTTNIPLASYPAAIKAVIPLIEAGKTEQARTDLLFAFDTLVVTTEIFPLPQLRAELLLDKAEKLAEQKDRSKAEEKQLKENLDAAEEYIQLAQILGYGKEEMYDPMYKSLEKIREKVDGQQAGTGWFDEIKQQFKEWF
ncbi:YfdX family protein [Candidatus Electrothrix sp.]|uniref:YfdX family protein n=1 Tax=Candidatus Electrothrix sp. TaxID=2170559 RepID=UPI0040559DBC